MPPPGAALGRRTTREPVSVVVTLLAEFGEKKVLRPSWILDVSMHGAKLRTSFWVPPGKTVNLSPKSRPTLTARGRVVWSRKRPFGQAEMGLEFLQLIPTDFWSEASWLR